MGKRSYHPPALDGAYRKTEALRALSNLRRLAVFLELTHQREPILFKALREKLNIPASSLSRILKLFKQVKLVTCTTHPLDRTMAVSVSPEMVRELCGIFFNAIVRLEPERAAGIRARSTEAAEAGSNVPEAAVAVA